MIKKHYAGMERRAENIIWNAAGQYDFDPPFMAFFENGKPDLYFNMIIGLAFKWLDMDRLNAFFESYASYHRAEEADELLWIGMENSLYEKEIPTRPVLEKLRKQRAQLFYRTRQTLSRQQMMLQSMLVYDQMEARWAAVLGKKEPALTPREKEIEKDLRFPGSMDTEEMIGRMSEFLKKFFHYSAGKGEDRKTASGGKAFGSVLRRMLKRENHYRDTLLVRSGSLEGDVEGSAQLARAGGRLKNVQNYELDQEYLRFSLGESCLPEQDLRNLENELCKGPHALCRLWVTDGRRQGGSLSLSASGAVKPDNEKISGSEEKNHKNKDNRKDHKGNKVNQKTSPAEREGILTGRDAADLQRVRKDALRQAERNRKWQREHSQLMASGVRHLSARMDEVLSSYERALPEESRKGSLRADIAYRLVVLHDPDVFLRAGDETERSVTVDLLLDASASRLNYQEQLAAQAAMIAKSCMAVHVPVQVECFRSLRGFTALEILKDRKSRDISRIADYFAGGWNRDGLGIRLASRFLPGPEEASVRILLTLTDASPNDSTHMPAENGGFLEREYQGRGAVLDAKEAVSELRKQGVKVGAVFLGPTLYMENLHTIYGMDCTRIHRIEQLEEAAASLLDQLMRENTGKAG